jgi:SAM-dependent methyltransferase
MKDVSNCKILDACCGSRMFWFDKDKDDVLFMDNRELSEVLCDGRTLNVHPDVIADFRHMPFPDGHFSLVVFDPPHLKQLGEKSWLALKYGRLMSTWRDDIKEGFEECMRVLKTDGVLIFKWNEDQISVKEVIEAIGQRPLFGNRKGEKSIWMVFMRG